MDSLQYRKWTAFYRTHPGLFGIIVKTNKVLTYAYYAMYPLLLVLLAFLAPELLVREIVVPAVLFIALSIFRKLYNQPRPYEVLDIDPLIHKDTKGKSFPSRHVFSSFMISICWIYFCVPVGIILIIGSVMMAIVRVLGGVHFPKDVIAGALVAIIGGVVGLWIIPWP